MQKASNVEAFLIPFGAITKAVSVKVRLIFVLYILIPLLTTCLRHWLTLFAQFALNFVKLLVGNGLFYANIS
jgi:hypothetical protein